MIIIPENLANTGKKYENLHEKMSEGYEESWQNNDFREDGSFAGIKNKENGLRIIIVKEIQNLEEDELHNATKGKSINDLESGVFEEKKVRGLDPATYLIYQREYYKEIGNHLDEKDWTWLPEVGRPASGRVPFVDWLPSNTQLNFISDIPSDRSDYLGCRLAGSLSI